MCIFNNFISYSNVKDQQALDKQEESTFSSVVKDEDDLKSLLQQATFIRNMRS